MGYMYCPSCCSCRFMSGTHTLLSLIWLMRRRCCPTIQCSSSFLHIQYFNYILCVCWFGPTLKTVCVRKISCSITLICSHECMMTLLHHSSQRSVTLSLYRPYPGGVTSKLATLIYVATVMPILYDNSYSPNDSNLKYES